MCHCRLQRLLNLSLEMMVQWKVFAVFAETEHEKPTVALRQMSDWSSRTDADTVGSKHDRSGNKHSRGEIVQERLFRMRKGRNRIKKVLHFWYTAMTSTTVCLPYLCTVFLLTENFSVIICLDHCILIVLFISFQLVPTIQRCCKDCKLIGGLIPFSWHSLDPVCGYADLILPELPDNSEGLCSLCGGLICFFSNDPRSMQSPITGRKMCASW